MLHLMSAESRVAQDHTLRAIKTVHQAVPKELSPTSDSTYCPDGREVVAGNGFTIG